MDEDVLSNASAQPSVAPGASPVAPMRELKGKKISPEILKYVPQESAEYYRFVPIGIKDSALEIGMVEPENTEARNAISFIADKLGMPFRIYQISGDDFHVILDDYKNLTSEVSKVLGEFDADLAGDERLTDAISKRLGDENQDIALIEDAPVTKIVAVIIRHAIDGNASDIHIEPIGDRVRVRFRVDGALYTSLFLPANVYDAVVARIKIISSLKLDEKRKPQDGRFSAPLDGRKVDFRVSTMPSYYGEKIAIRILDSEKGVKSLADLALSDNHRTMIKDALARPYGLILITGPTGSGKSTTLYAMLNELDREKYNVVSLEDPVEFSVTGVNQSQVRPEIGYTFANGLRSILRQDPDMIMVGEIRDKETAELAVQAALTGHLVFSTLHTNNAIGVIPRLIDMGIDPYLIAPTLTLAIAQRLVRQLCPDGKEPEKIEGGIKAIIDKEFEDLPKEFMDKIQIPSEVFHAKPSPLCPGGTRGRMAVFEMFEIDHEMEALILKNPTELSIRALARSKGMLSMKEDALIKGFGGLIPFEEASGL
ncbi:MAG TPA: GspE/PulE family protein [Candidatus Paceibacterota bacterium]